MHDEHSHGADAFRTMMMAIELKLVEPYLKTFYDIKLPTHTGKAEEYTDSGRIFDDSFSKKPLWETFSRPF